MTIRRRKRFRITAKMRRKRRKPVKHAVFIVYLKEMGVRKSEKNEHGSTSPPQHCPDI
jgi:hypothetical protein